MHSIPQLRPISYGILPRIFQTLAVNIYLFVTCSSFSNLEESKKKWVHLRVIFSDSHRDEDNFDELCTYFRRAFFGCSLGYNFCYCVFAFFCSAINVKYIWMYHDMNKKSKVKYLCILVTGCAFLEALCHQEVHHPWESDQDCYQLAPLETNETSLSLHEQDVGATAACY